MMTTMDKIRIIEEQLPLDRSMDWMQSVMEQNLRELKERLCVEQGEEIDKSVWLDSLSRLEG
jgi:hypothetical protein